MTQCSFEPDVIDALASRRWPARIDDELRAHVASCESCADLADVAGAFMREDDVAFGEAAVPPAASVWHKAQLRAREEAARAAMRPIGFVQGVAFSFGVAAVIGAFIWGLPLLAPLVPDFSSMFTWLRAPSVSLPSVDVDMTALLSNTTVQLAVAAWALLAPIAVYFAISRESS